MSHWLQVVVAAPAHSSIAGPLTYQSESPLAPGALVRVPLGKREVLGVGAHPLAFVVQRPWIGGAVQVLLDDPADPTPYWVVSTRHPVELATALLASLHPPGDR